MIILLLSLDFNGYLRNDAMILITEQNDYNFYNVDELKLSFWKKEENWMFYIDGRIFIFFPENIFQGSYSVFVKRAFLRIFLKNINITFGKQYINLGIPIVFNPFEIDKKIVFTDLGYTKEGIIAFSGEIMINPKSGIKIFTKPNFLLKNSSLGCDIYTNLKSFDLGIVFLSENNILSTGFYLKGDLFLGINTSNRFYYDRINQRYNVESVSGFDYSFFQGRLFLGSSYYYNKENNYYLLKSNRYLYSFINYNFSEFINFSLNIFTNVNDRSSLFIPQLTYNFSQGLYTGIYFITPIGNDEFSQSNLGKLITYLRIEGRF